MSTGAVSLLQSLVRARTLSGEEGLAADVLIEFLAALPGVQVERLGHNVLARVGSGGPELWLNSHLDTVAAATGYSFDPWCGDLTEDGRILGLGANDAKGSVAAMAAAFANLATAWPQDRGTLVLAATAEEEIGGEGLKRLRRELPAPDAIIVGEPNDCRIANCCKGVVLADVVVRGKSAHVSRPWQGESAARLAAPVLAALVADHGLAVDPDLGPATHEVTLLAGGHQRNALPDRVEFKLDARTTPTFDNDAMAAHLAALIAEFPAAELTIVAKDVRATRTPAEGRLVQAGLAVTGQDQPAAFVGVCDFVYCRDVDAIVCGPGQPERSHRADEFIRVEELERGVEVYAEIVWHYFARE